MSKPLHIIRRNRRKKNTEEVTSELDMTSMIDVVFLLLIFFMCATKFKQPEGELSTYLPRDRGSSGGKPTVDPGCRISVWKEGSEIVAFRDADMRIPSRTTDNWGDDLEAAQADERGSATGADVHCVLGIVPSRDHGRRARLRHDPDRRRRAPAGPPRLRAPDRPRSGGPPGATDWPQYGQAIVLQPPPPCHRSGHYDENGHRHARCPCPFVLYQQCQL